MPENQQTTNEELDRTHSRRLEPSSFFQVVLLFPLTISNARTPKLYMSALSVKYPRIAYSGAMYPLQIKKNRSCINKQKKPSH